MGRLRSELDYTSIQDVIEIGMHEYIDQFQIRLNALGEAIQKDFFTNTMEDTTPQQSQTQSSS
jgi:uncharacterized alpha-E superfamily protein